MTESLRSLLSFLPLFFLLLLKIAVLYNTKKVSLYWFLFEKFDFQNVNFRNHSNLFPGLKIKERSSFLFRAEMSFSPFPPYAFFKKAVFFKTIIITWIITLQIYVHITFLTIEELGILKITQKPLEELNQKKGCLN